MTRLLTRILLPGERHGWGLMDWGELTAEEMIGQYRRHAAYLRKQVEAIEAAADGDFKIDVVRGSHKEQHVRSIQLGRPALAAAARKGGDVKQAPSLMSGAVLSDSEADGQNQSAPKGQHDG